MDGAVDGGKVGGARTTGGGSGMLGYALDSRTQNAHRHACTHAPLHVTRHPLHAAWPSDARLSITRSVFVNMLDDAAEAQRRRVALDKPGRQPPPQLVGHVGIRAGMTHLNVTFEPPRTGPEPTIYFLLLHSPRVHRGPDSPGATMGGGEEAILCLDALPTASASAIEQEAEQTARQLKHLRRQSRAYQSRVGRGQFNAEMLGEFTAMQRSLEAHVHMLAEQRAAVAQAKQAAGKARRSNDPLQMRATGLSAGTAFEFFSITGTPQGTHH